MLLSFRDIRIPICGALLGCLAASAQPPVPPPLPAAEAAGLSASADDPLPGLLAEALRNNPALKAARLEAPAMEAEAGAAAAWMAPEVGVEFNQAPLDAFPNPLKDQEEIAYSVEQSIPLPGRSAAMAGPALRRAESARERARALEVSLARQVKEAYLDLYLADAGRRINAENQALIRRLVESARKQYEVGIGSQGDILKAHTELASLSLAAVELSESREAALGRLNALLDRAPDSAFTPAERLRPVAARFPFDKVLALARDRHPALRALDAEVGVREAEAAAAGRELWPALKVKGSYKDMRRAPVHGGSAEDGWGLMVGMDLPFAFWSAQGSRGSYRSAGTRAQMARLDRKAEESRLASEIRAALASQKAAAEALDLARAALLPHAEQALRSVQSAYDNGKADFLEMMDAYRMAIEAREQELAAAVKVARSRADLEAAVGMPVGDLARALGGAATPGLPPAGSQGGRP